MRKLILCAIIFILFLPLNAQEKGKIRLGADIGLGLTSNGGGFNGGIDLKYNIINNLNAGVKFNLATLVKDYSQNYSTTGVVSNLLIISDYYFYNGSGSFAPFIGGGFGLFRNQNIYVDENANNNIIWKDIPVTQSYGGVIRTGFEFGKIRLSAEYYIVPSSTLYDIYLNSTGQNSKNNFINLSVGLYIGGGKWGKTNN